MKVSIGLPKFLLESENTVLVLTSFFVSVIILVPAFFFWCYSSSLDTNELQLIKESGQVFQSLLNEQVNFVMMSKIFSLVKNFEDCNI